MLACNLTINGVVVQLISGNGTMNYPLGQSGATATVSCGNVTQNISVISYVPKFTQNLYNTTSGTVVNVVFTTNGMNQVVTAGG
jgi:hypothetical protein